MPSSDTDRDWERFGATDPYYGVLADDRFRSGNLSEEARREFFRTGEEHVAHVLARLRRHVDPAFRPSRVLDFGCGVGRIVVPFAPACDEVVGVDVSASMLAEAERNCAARGVANARFVLADDSLSRLDGTFDLVHSFIVFQHLPVDRGERLLSLLLDRIAPGGAGALHFLVGERRTAAQRLAAFVRRRVPLGRNVVNVLRGRPFGAPNMEMNAYDAGRLLRILGDHGVGEVCVEGTDHGGYLGAMLVFRREPRAPTS